jgi:16S rRNA U516 pseudouridylate synthase RsuA-like enzyme
MLFDTRAPAAAVEHHVLHFKRIRRGQLHLKRVELPPASRCFNE